MTNTMRDSLLAALNKKTEDGALEIPDDSKIDWMESYSLSKFDLKSVGIKKDPTKDYRWVEERNVENRKARGGYSLVTGNPHSPDGYYKIEKMMLMVRSMDKKNESDRFKRMRTLEQTSASREAFEQEVERLSYKHDMNLQKKVSKGYQDN